MVLTWLTHESIPHKHWHTCAREVITSRELLADGIFITWPIWVSAVLCMWRTKGPMDFELAQVNQLEIKLKCCQNSVVILMIVSCECFENGPPPPVVCRWLCELIWLLFLITSLCRAA